MKKGAASTQTTANQGGSSPFKRGCCPGALSAPSGDDSGAVIQPYTIK